MPIVNVFDYPQGGANGGFVPGAGGAASLTDLSWNVVDLTDGSWTLLDPDSLVDTTYGTNGVTFDGTFNTIQWNTLAAGSSNYNWAAGTTHRGPRWYKLLTIDGTQIDNQANLVMNTYLNVDETVNDFDQAMLIGAALDPTSTASATIDGTGAYYKKDVGLNQFYGVWTVNGQTSGSAATYDYSIGQIFRSLDSLGTAMAIVYNSSDTPLNQAVRQSNQNAATGATVNVYIMVGIGTAASNDTVTAGDQQKFAMSYRSLTLGDPT